MKITFSNLGSIKKTTLDLRPLTVIIGPNNTNKTYIAYSIYGLWDSLRKETTKSVYTLGLEHTSGTNFSINVENLFDYMIEDTEQIVKIFNEELKTFFQDSSKKLFTNVGFEMQLAKNELQNALKKMISAEENPFARGYKFSSHNGALFMDVRNSLRDKNIISLDDEFTAAHRTIWGLKFLLFSRPFLLPAERNAFIITYKILAHNRLKHLRLIQRERISPRSERELELLREQGVINYPQPIEDFLDFLTDVEFEKNINNDSVERRKFCQIADEIEASIQGKNKTGFKPTKLGGKELKVNVKKGLDIDLYNASSSIKQLAPLLLYLRYRAKENDLLIIDEPEMNLHPESQAKFLEVLGMLVNAGVNVLLTTHSPYFMSHLNNLVSGKTDDEKTLKEQAKSLYLKDERAFLKMDDVSAYEMKNNKLVSLKDKDYGIRWDTLSDVSADIQQKFFEIYEKGEQPTDGEEE
ncbi:MAG TPA: AAA family ATPase [Pyrinomonadaceae bacterium]|nr:AAA family ATPase [Pyrinomonadaceae bacterium]